MDAFTAATFLRSQGLLLEADSFAEALVQWRLDHPKEGPDFRQINTTQENLSAVAAQFDIVLEGPLLAEAEKAFNLASIASSIALPGIYEVILSLKEQVKLAVVSNTRSHQLIEGIVAYLGFQDVFDPIITSEQCGFRKPSPHIFQTVLDAWRLAPESIVMIGDLPHKDVTGAQALGLRTIWLCTDALPCEDHGADAVAELPADILPILASWGLSNEPS
jgi:HAD superfamily hydrolase (TIGR01509 family)